MAHPTVTRTRHLWTWIVLAGAWLMPGALHAFGGDSLLDEPKQGVPITAFHILEALGLPESPRVAVKGDSWGAGSQEFDEWSRLVDTPLSPGAMLDEIGKKLQARGWMPGEPVRREAAALQTWRAKDGDDEPWVVLFYVTRSPDLRDANLVLLRLTPLGKLEPRRRHQSRSGPGLALPEADEPASQVGEPLLVPQENEARAPAYRVLQAIGLKEPEDDTHRFWSTLETANRGYNDWNVRVESDLSAPELLDELSQKLRDRGWQPAGKAGDGEIALQTWGVEDTEGRPWTALLYISESDKLPGSRYVLLRLTKLPGSPLKS